MYNPEDWRGCLVHRARETPQLSKMECNLFKLACLTLLPEIPLRNLVRFDLTRDIILRVEELTTFPGYQ
jgi:hypothetical protein